MGEVCKPISVAAGLKPGCIGTDLTSEQGLVAGSMGIGLDPESSGTGLALQWALTLSLCKRRKEPESRRGTDVWLESKLPHSRQDQHPRESPLQLWLPLSGFQTVRDPSPSCTLNRVVGESVQLPLNHTLSPDIREIEWKWNTEAEQQQLLVSWKPSGPEWYEFEGKYKHRFCLTEKYILNISNLTVEMSGLYVAEIKYNTGKSQKKDFRLCVHEPG
nr:uncharacterized protein LOC114082428 [Marmota flaviventris]